MFVVAKLAFGHNGQPDRHGLYDLGQAVASWSPRPRRWTCWTCSFTRWPDSMSKRRAKFLACRKE
jgi:hypothetical protein